MLNMLMWLFHCMSAQKKISCILHTKRKFNKMGTFIPKCTVAASFYLWSDTKCKPGKTSWGPKWHHWINDKTKTQAVFNYSLLGGGNAVETILFLTGYYQHCAMQKHFLAISSDTTHCPWNKKHSLMSILRKKPQSSGKLPR